MATNVDKNMWNGELECLWAYINAARMGITTDVSQKAKNRTAIFCGYTTVRHVTKIFHILLQIYLLLHVHCSSAHQWLEIGTCLDFHQNKNINLHKIDGSGK